VSSGGPNVAAVGALLGELERVPVSSFVHLARFYDRAEQAARDRAWDEVRETVEFWHRGEALDEIRRAAIDLVTVAHSGRHVYQAGPIMPGLFQPDAGIEEESREVNAIIEAAGATLMRDQLSDEAYERLVGPVRDLLEVEGGRVGDRQGGDRSG
jgi:hypothetical protein